MPKKKKAKGSKKAPMKGACKDMPVSQFGVKKGKGKKKDPY